MVQLMVQIDLTAGSGPAAVDAVRPALAGVRAEPGCEEYRAFVKGDKLFVVEAWASDEDLAAHAKSPAYTALINALTPLLAGAPSMVAVTEVDEHVQH